MKFLKNNAYWILSIVFGLGIGSIITLLRMQSQPPAPEQETPAVAEQTQEPSKRPINATPRLTSRKTHQNIGPIRTMHNYPETPPQLPTDALKRRDLMLRPLVKADKHLDWRDDGPHLTAEASQIELEAFTGGMPLKKRLIFWKSMGSIMKRS